MIGCNPQSVELEKGEKLHDLQIHNLYLIQKADGYCFTSDSVLLANFVKMKKDQHAIELCAGSGVVSVLACAKNQYSSIVAIELQQSLAALCKRNFEINNIENSRSLCMRVQDAPKELGTEIADVVFCNPPFFKSELLSAENQERAIARKEICLNVDELIFAASKLLKFGGNFYLVHQTERMAEIFEKLKKNNIEPKEAQLIQPKSNKNSNIFLVRATKGGKSGIKFLPTLVMYDEQGNETKELREIYQRKIKK